MPKPQEPWEKEGASGNPSSNNCSSYVGCIVFGKLNLLKKKQEYIKNMMATLYFW